MFANFDLIPPGASQPLIKPRSIDDVPILAVTLWSDRYDHYDLRRIAAQVHDEIKQVTDVSEVKLIGGQRRQLRVTLDEARMAAFQATPDHILGMLQQANRQLQSGSFAAGNREFLVETGGFLTKPKRSGRSSSESPTGGRSIFGTWPRSRTGPKNRPDYVLFGQGRPPSTATR